MKRVVTISRILLFTIIIFISNKSNAQQSIQVSTSRFIAYSLYNFSKFIDWPSDMTKNTFQICVIGDKEVYQELLKISENKKQGNATYQITLIKNIDELRGFNHIVYLSNQFSGKVKILAANEANRGILFVTEREGMTRLGSSISFMTDANGMMGFEIARANAEKKNLSIQKQLERLALKVI